MAATLAVCEEDARLIHDAFAGQGYGHASCIIGIQYAEQSLGDREEIPYGTLWFVNGRGETTEMLWAFYYGEADCDIATAIEFTEAAW